MTTTTPIQEDEKSLPFELDAHPGVASIKKLLNGFCGGGSLFKEEVWESTSDIGRKIELSEPTEGIVTTNRDVVVPNLPVKRLFSEQANETQRPEACGESIETTTTSSVASATEEKISVSEERKSSEDKKDESDTEDKASPVDEAKDLGESTEGEDGCVEVVTDATAVEIVELVKRELEVEEVSAAESKGAKGSKSSFPLLSFLWFVLLALFVAFQSGEFQVDFSQQGMKVFRLKQAIEVDFSQQGMKDFGLRLQQAVERELVQSTSKLIDIKDMVKDVMEGNLASANTAAEEEIEVTANVKEAEKEQTADTAVEDEPKVTVVEEEEVDATADEAEEIDLDVAEVEEDESSMNEVEAEEEMVQETDGSLEESEDVVADGIDEETPEKHDLILDDDEEPAVPQGKPPVAFGLSSTRGTGEAADVDKDALSGAS